MATTKVGGGRRGAGGGGGRLENPKMYDIIFQQSLHSFHYLTACEYSKLAMVIFFQSFGV